MALPKDHKRTPWWSVLVILFFLGDATWIVADRFLHLPSATVFLLVALVVGGYAALDISVRIIGLIVYLIASHFERLREEKAWREDVLNELRKRR